MPAKDLDQIVNLCKRRGFVYPSAEIYGGFRSSYDYGPLGSLILTGFSARHPTAFPVTSASSSWQSLPTPIRSGCMDRANAIARSRSPRAIRADLPRAAWRSVRGAPPVHLRRGSRLPARPGACRPSAFEGSPSRLRPASRTQARRWPAHR